MFIFSAAFHQQKTNQYVYAPINGATFKKKKKIRLIRALCGMWNHTGDK
jgi:hypothetical protein